VSDGRFDDVVPALTGRYFASLAYTDRAVKEFVESMQKKYPDTYFFLYGDHTPYVINEGAFRRSVLRDEDEKEMVPLFIITPNSQKRREHGAVASYLDFAPTVLHAAGIPYTSVPSGSISSRRTRPCCNRWSTVAGNSTLIRP